MAHGETARSSAASSTPTINDASTRPEVDDEEKKSVAQKESEFVTDTAQAVDAVEDADAEHGEHPDGGLRAWMVVIGVSGYMRLRMLFRILTNPVVCCRSMCDVWSCQRVGCESCRPVLHPSWSSQTRAGLPSVLHNESSCRNVPFDNVSLSRVLPRK